MRPANHVWTRAAATASVGGGGVGAYRGRCPGGGGPPTAATATWPVGGAPPASANATQILQVDGSDRVGRVHRRGAVDESELGEALLHFERGERGAPVLRRELEHALLRP